MTRKTVAQSIQEQSNVELLPERNNKAECKECVCTPWYASFWFWLIVVVLVIGAIFWRFF